MPDAPFAPPPKGGALAVRSGLLTFVLIAAVTLIFVDVAWLTLLATGALGLYLTLGWRRFSIGTRVLSCCPKVP